MESILSDDCSLDSEVGRRIKAASSAFGRLVHRVFLNRNLAILTKVAVHKAVCVSMLPPDCETWTPYRRHIKALEDFHTRCLQTILGIDSGRKYRRPRCFRGQKLNRPSICWLKDICWLGHLIHMPDNRLRRRLLHGQLSLGQRSVGGLKKRFTDHIKSTLMKCHVSLSDLETFASDRDVWKTCMSSGL